MGSYGGATALWFDDDTQRWAMDIPGSCSRSHHPVIARMLTASVLHYTYTPYPLPPRERTDISVDISVTDFSQAWQELQELFRKQIDWHRKHPVTLSPPPVPGHVTK
jgi:hypothetical protein